MMEKTLLELLTKHPFRPLWFEVSILWVLLIFADNEEEQYGMMETTHDWKMLKLTIEGTRWGTNCQKKLNFSTQ